MALQLPSLPGASATRPGKQGAMPPRITGSASAAIAVLGTGGVIGSTVSAAGPGVYIRARHHQSASVPQIVLVVGGYDGIGILTRHESPPYLYRHTARPMQRHPTALPGLLPLPNSFIDLRGLFRFAQTDNSADQRNRILSYL